jgi:type II secretory pathway component PulF
MALYHYQALSKNGKRISGSIDATSLKSVQSQLISQGLFPIKVTQPDEARASFSFKSLFERKISIKEKIFFTKQLAVLLKAGIPLVDALSLLAEQSEGGLQKIVITLRDTIKEGKSLADGLAMYPKTFETIYVQLVKAGEASGRLEVVLERLTEYQEERDVLRKKVKGALTYPLIQLGVIGIVTVILLTFVVPSIADMFVKQGVDLPWPTKVLMAISNFTRSYFLLLGIAFFTLFIAYRSWKKTPKGAYFLDAMKLRLPIVKYFARTGAVVQFCRTLGMLVEGGVNLSEALDIVCKIVDNRVLVDELLKARDKIVKQGQIAEYLKGTGIFPPVAIYLINTGEQSGQLAQMLLTVAQTQEAELKELSDGLTSKLNPIMLLVMAVLLGFIVIAIILPISQIGSAISSQSSR